MTDVTVALSDTQLTSHHQRARSDILLTLQICFFGQAWKPLESRRWLVCSCVHGNLLLFCVRRTCCLLSCFLAVKSRRQKLFSLWSFSQWTPKWQLGLVSIQMLNNSSSDSSSSNKRKFSALPVLDCGYLRDLCYTNREPLCRLSAVFRQLHPSFWWELGTSMPLRICASGAFSR